jgi:hypothetical protein
MPLTGQRVPHEMRCPISISPTGRPQEQCSVERAIRTAKNHLAAMWYSTDDNFPLYLWDKTIPQAELTLNLLRGSRINPKLSAAWEQIHGRYDFNAHPIAPPGIKVLAHAKPAQRKTWETHAFEAWYVGPAMDHYRCHTVWATTTRQIRIVNQLKMVPTENFPPHQQLRPIAGHS